MPSAATEHAPNPDGPRHVASVALRPPRGERGVQQRTSLYSEAAPSGANIWAWIVNISERGDVGTIAGRGTPLDPPPI